MIRNFILILMLATSLNAVAQHTIAGKIEYERKVNIHAQLADMENADWVEKLKANIPKFNTSYFDMSFDGSHTYYKPGREAEGANIFKMFGSGPATENVVLTDFNANTVKASKAVFEQTFFVNDSIRTIDWKEKDEIRTIAGFKCHKAVSRICDSVYVVAFYTEDIPTAGGPEMFAGLPGMIMELAIPRLHCTWVATKVEIVAPDPAKYTVPEKGKKVNEKELYDAVSGSFKKWGNMADRNVWWIVL